MAGLRVAGEEGLRGRLSLMVAGGKREQLDSTLPGSQRAPATFSVLS